MRLDLDREVTEVAMASINNSAVLFLIPVIECTSSLQVSFGPDVCVAGKVFQVVIRENEMKYGRLMPDGVGSLS